MNENQKLEFLNEIYYKQKLFFGRDKLWTYFKENYPNSKLSKRFIMDFLKKQEVHQINQVVKQKKSTKSVVSYKTGYIQIDLVDMSSFKERQFSWIFTAIDVFSRKANAIPLSKKSTGSVLRAIDKLLSVFDNVSVIQSDNGNEFVNKEMKEYYNNKNIKHITSKEYTPQTNGKVERFNGTIKRLILQNMTVNKTRLWIKDLSVLLNNYNNTIHRSIEFNPNEVSGNEQKVIENNQKSLNKKPEVPIFNVGDFVRVVLKKGKLDKKSVNNFTSDLYTIYKKIKSKKDFILESYKLKDSDGDLIRGVYNSTELLFVSRPRNNRG